MKKVDEDLMELIDTHGWSVRGVVDPDPAYCLAYTVGLTGRRHPEIVMTGMDPRESYDFLRLACEAIIDGRAQFLAGQETSALTDGRPLPILPVEDTSSLTAVESIYGRVRAVQIVWTDSEDRLPWEPGFSNPPEWQPLLGPRPGAENIGEIFVDVHQIDGGYPKPYDVEALQVERLNEPDHYRVMETPLWAVGIARFDVLAAEEWDGKVWATHCVESAQHWVARVFPTDPDELDACRREFVLLGCHTRTGETMFVADAPPTVAVDHVMNLLESGVVEGLWEYDLGTVPKPEQT